MTNAPPESLTERDDFRKFLTHLDNVAVWAGDEAGFEYVSPAFEDIWGRPVADVLADRSVVIEGTHPEDRDRVRAAMEDSEGRLERGETIEVEHRVVRPDGEVRWVEARVFPVRDASDAPQVVGVTIDITERKRAELELERQNERLDRFARIVSHDLRSPLSTAQGYLELLREGVDSEHVDPIERALVRMDEIITDVLTLARTGSTVETTDLVDPAAVARRAWTMTTHEGARLAVEDGVGSIAADESQLRQLFENLFRNAVEHGSTSSPSPPDAAVDPAVTVRLGPLDDGPGFYVADDGPGIADAERERIFEPGYSNSPEGTGLGLLIVKEIADAHGWTVRVTRSAAGGARFEVRGVETA